MRTSKPAMDEYAPYLIMRSTYKEPHHYGASLRVIERGDNELDLGKMVSTQFDVGIWRQAGRIITTAFGGKAWKRLVPEHGDLQCVYTMEDSAWSDKHPRPGDELWVYYRIPGSDPDEDVWESAGAADIDDAVKVTDDDTTWYVLPASDEKDVYLLIPAEIATKSLRRAARLPSWDDASDSSSDDGESDDRCALQLCIVAATALQCVCHNTCVLTLDLPVQQREGRCVGERCSSKEGKEGCRLYVCYRKWRVLLKRRAAAKRAKIIDLVGDSQ